VLHTFFSLQSKDLNDACYDLQKQESWKQIEETLLRLGDTEQQIGLINSFLQGIFISRQAQLDYIVRDAVQMILESRAQISVRELSAALFVTPRTFERRFLKEVGLTARDFIQITKFQQSLEQLATKDYTKLTDIVYTNGFTDQSHFIKVFKAFTGQTPGRFMRD
jgi:AraC-like DNA-binding protein